MGDMWITAKSQSRFRLGRQRCLTPMPDDRIGGGATKKESVLGQLGGILFGRPGE